MSGPSPDTQEAREPLENKAQLIGALSKGSKPKENWRIGTEHEKFPFLTDTLRPVPYDGARSIRALLEGLRDRFGWQGVYENDNIIALSDPNGMGNVSLEPGGQFNFPAHPLKRSDTCEEVNEHLVKSGKLAARWALDFCLSASPTGAGRAQ